MSAITGEQGQPPRSLFRPRGATPATAHPICHEPASSEDLADFLPHKILVISDAWAPQVNGVVRSYENIARVLRSQGRTMEVIGPGNFVTLRTMSRKPSD